MASTGPLLSLTLRCTSLDQHDVTVLYSVVFALGHHLALGLDFRLVTQLLERIEVVHNSLDEGLLEISVNDTSRLRRLGAVTDRPLTDLIGTSGEEATKLERLAHLQDDLGQSRLSTNVLLLLLGLCLRLIATETLLVADGEGDDGVTLSVLLDPLGDLRKMLVLLANVVLL